MKKILTLRTSIIIAAAILVILIFLYLGGLVGQLLSGYQTWLNEDGITGNAQMSAPNLNPLHCLAFVFSREGLFGVMIVVGITAGIIIFIMLHNRFGSNDFDERNFKRSKSGVYGTAGWMSKKEMKSVLEVASPGNAQGIILGKIDGSVICLPADTMLNKHVFVFGASGTMKSRAIVRPYLFQSIKRGESVVITDVKGELYSDTAEMFRRNGYKVRVFNLINPEHSDSWNCMGDLDGDTMMAQILTNVTINNTGKGKPDHFWDNGEGNLLKSLILYIDQDSSRSPDAKHLPAVYQMLTQNTERSLSAIFDKLPISHPAKAPYNLFAQASDTVRAGIVLGLGTRLQILQNEAMRNILSKSELDLTEPGKRKCAYFVILSDQEGSTEFISSLFFSMMFIKMTRYADSTPELRCKVPVNIVFDEFCNIGQLDTYPRRLSVARSRLIQVLHVAQSLAQLKNRYMDDQWAEILGNCDTQVMLGCTEEQTAKFFSDRSGDMSVDVNSTMTVRQTIAVAQVIPQYRYSESVGKRKLLTPDEVYRLPNDEMLIIVRGEKILRANKFDYTGHPMSKRMKKVSIMDYCPQDKLDPQTETEYPWTDGDELLIPVKSGKPCSKTDAPGTKPASASDTSFSQTEIKKPRKSPGGSSRRQTENKNPQNLAAPATETALSQTETKKSLKSPEDSPFLDSLPPEFASHQTDNINNNLCADRNDICKKREIHSQSDSEEAGNPTPQTETKKKVKRGGRRTKNHAAPPDYSNLLDNSFNRQPQNPPTQTESGSSSPDADDHELSDELFIADMPQTGVGLFPDDQPAESTSAASELSEIYNISISRIGDDEPPDDF